MPGANAACTDICLLDTGLLGTCILDLMQEAAALNKVAVCNSYYAGLQEGELHMLLGSMCITHVYMFKTALRGVAREAYKQW